MKLDPVLLSMACSWSMKAYNETNRDATKIESGLTSTTAFVIQRKTIDIIVFRGTQQVGDWAFNLFPVPVPYAGRLCHAGFVAAHASVWDDIEPYIDYNKRTLICGHSLGGALAELSAAKLNGKHDNLEPYYFWQSRIRSSRVLKSP
jgi:predicted lipase